MAKKVKKVKVVRTPQGVRRVRQRVVSPDQQQKANQNSELVTVDDNTIAMILADPRYIETIPCLKSGKQSLANVGKRCGRCTRKRNQARKKAMQDLKSCVAGLRGEQAKNFKRLLGAKKVRVYQAAGKGKQPVPTTF